MRNYASFFLFLIKNKEQRRYAFSWVFSLKKNYLLKKPSPWLTFGAINFLEDYFKTHKNIKVFEYGSGGSTLYWLKKGASCVSVEHNSEWFSLINSLVKDNPLIDYKFVAPSTNTPDEQEIWNPSNPFLYGTDEGKEFNYEAYVKQIDLYPDKYFDIILIDGRARTSCLFQSYNKVKQGGIIVLDNADREYYLENTRQYLTNFILKEFKGSAPGLPQSQQTNIYIFSN